MALYNKVFNIADTGKTLNEAQLGFDEAGGAAAIRRLFPYGQLRALETEQGSPLTDEQLKAMYEESIAKAPEGSPTQAPSKLFQNLADLTMLGATTGMFIDPSAGAGDALANNPMLRPETALGGGNTAGWTLGATQGTGGLPGGATSGAADILGAGEAGVQAGTTGATTAAGTTAATGATAGGATAAGTGAAAAGTIPGAAGKFSFGKMGDIFKALGGGTLSKLFGGGEESAPGINDIMTPMMKALGQPITEAILSNLMANTGARDNMLQSSKQAYQGWNRKDTPAGWQSMTPQERQQYVGNRNAQDRTSALESLGQERGPSGVSGQGEAPIQGQLGGGPSVTNTPVQQPAMPAPTSPANDWQPQYRNRNSPMMNTKTGEVLSQEEYKQKIATQSGQAAPQRAGALKPTDFTGMNPQEQEAFIRSGQVPGQRPGTTSRTTTPTATVEPGTDREELRIKQRQQPDNITGPAGPSDELPDKYPALDFLEPQVWSDYGGKLQLDTPEGEKMIQDMLSGRLGADAAGKAASYVANKQRGLAEQGNPYMGLLQKQVGSFSPDNQYIGQLGGVAGKLGQASDNPYIKQLADIYGKLGTPAANEFIQKLGGTGARSENEQLLGSTLAKALGTQADSGYANALYESSVSPLRRELERVSGVNAAELAGRGLGTSTVISDVNQPLQQEFLGKAGDISAQSQARAAELAQQERQSAAGNLLGLETAVGQRGQQAFQGAGQLQQALNELAQLGQFRQGEGLKGAGELQQAMNELNQTGLYRQAETLGQAGSLTDALGRLKLAGKESDIGALSILSNLGQRERELSSNIYDQSSANALLADTAQRQNISDYMQLMKQQEDRSLLNMQLPYEEWQRRVQNQNQSVNQAIGAYAGQTPLMETANQNAMTTYQNSRADKAGLNQSLINLAGLFGNKSAAPSLTAQPVQYNPVAQNLPAASPGAFQTAKTGASTYWERK